MPVHAPEWLKNRPRGFSVTSLLLSIIILIGCGCLLSASVNLIKTTMFVQRAATATGVVEGLHKSGDRWSTYEAEVVFTTRDGYTSRFRSRTVGSSPPYKIGDKVPVCYDPRDPDEAEIKAFSTIWMPLVMLSLVGIAFIVSGGLLMAARQGSWMPRHNETVLQRGRWEPDGYNRGQEGIIANPEQNQLTLQACEHAPPLTPDTPLPPDPALVPDLTFTFDPPLTPTREPIERDEEPVAGSWAVKSETHGEMLSYWISTIICNIMALHTGCNSLWEVFTKGNKIELFDVLPIFFLLIGFLSLWMAIRKTFQVLRFGEIVLSMDPFPGCIGGEVGGTVVVPIPYTPENSFQVKLSCKHMRITSDINQSSLVWQENGRAVATPAKGGTKLVFRFAVPANLPPSKEDTGGFYKWIVRFTAKIPGLNLDRSFDIPMVAAENTKLTAIPVASAPDLQLSELPAGIVRLKKKGMGSALEKGKLD